MGKYYYEPLNSHSDCDTVKFTLQKVLLTYKLQILFQHGDLNMSKINFCIANLYITQLKHCQCSGINLICRFIIGNLITSSAGRL